MLWVLCVLGSPELDTVLQVGSHKIRMEGQNHLPQPAGLASLDAVFHVSLVQMGSLLKTQPFLPTSVSSVHYSFHTWCLIFSSGSFSCWFAVCIVPSPPEVFLINVDSVFLITLPDFIVFCSPLPVLPFFFLIILTSF